MGVDDVVPPQVHGFLRGAHVRLPGDLVVGCVGDAQAHLGQGQVGFGAFDGILIGTVQQIGQRLLGAFEGFLGSGQFGGIDLLIQRGQVKFCLLQADFGLGYPVLRIGVVQAGQELAGLYPVAHLDRHLGQHVAILKAQGQLVAGNQRSRSAGGDGQVPVLTV
jgi:hypothetical protein